MIIFLDPGHGDNTPGKRSPDGKLREYKYAREIAAEVKKQLEQLGHTVMYTITGDNDMPLSQRCHRVNEVCKSHGSGNVIVVSIHCNAAGADNKWHDAKGWSVFVGLNASDKSQKLAGCLFDYARKYGLHMRPCSFYQKYWKQNLAICRDTDCPAVLTENLFQDNKEDVEYLLSDEGRKTIAKLHVDGIVEYLKLIGK